MLSSALKTTLKIQPAIILFSSVSILAKFAAGRLPRGEMTLTEKLATVTSDWRILGLVALMFLVLGVYAVIWQLLIRNAQIAVIYANKSSYLLWAQLAAVFFFGEHITLTNILGIMVIFGGILLANGGMHESA